MMWIARILFVEPAERGLESLRVARWEVFHRIQGRSIPDPLA
jgi:hypothetical protein